MVLGFRPDSSFPSKRENLNTRDPIVLITGGLSGIGRAKVMVAGRRDEAGKVLVKQLCSFGSEAEFIKADIRKDDYVRALVDKTVARSAVSLFPPVLTSATCRTPNFTYSIPDTSRSKTSSMKWRRSFAASSIGNSETL